MSELLHIEEPVTPAQVAPSLRAFLEYAFRPLYLAGALWAAISIAIWVFAPGLISGELQGVAWHAHEMLWGFVATIAVGFLMTAGANWTGMNPLQGPLLGIACVLWLVPRPLFLFGHGRGWFIAAAACELAFFLVAAGAMLRAVHATRNVRNYAVPWLIVALGAADLLFLRAALGGDYESLMRSFSAGLLVMTAIALLVGRRVIPFFAMRAIDGLQVPMLMRIGHLQLALCATAVALAALGQTTPLAAVLAVIGALALAQVLAWKPMAVLGKPLLWILYLGYTGLGIGLLLAGAHIAGWTARAAVHIHVIAVAGFSVLIIGMLTRTALGHLSRPLALDTSMRASYVLVILAAVTRLFALASSDWALLSLQCAAVAWIAAFSLYLWRFFPMMIRPRLAPPAVFKTNLMPRVVKK